jgi:hypothetical protein
VRGARKGQTFGRRKWSCQEGSIETRDQGLRKQLRSNRELKKTFKEVFRLEFVKEQPGHPAGCGK